MTAPLSFLFCDQFLLIVPVIPFSFLFTFCVSVCYFLSASDVDIGEIGDQVAAAEGLPAGTPVALADKAYHGLPGFTTPFLAPEVPAASAAVLDDSVLKVAARQRVEGLNHCIKSWKVAATTFRPTNAILHSECIIVAALLADYFHHLRNH